MFACVLMLFLFFMGLSGNYIFQGQAAGIAVNENGRGIITGIEQVSFL